MGDPDEDYCITYPTERLSNRETPIPDGGTPSTNPTNIALETRERLTAVETQVSRIGQGMARVESKMDAVQSDVQSVDEKALDKDYFRNHYREDIERNNRIRAFAMWAGGVIIAILGIITALVGTGVFPI